MAQPSDGASEATFRPFIPDEAKVPEFTLRAVLFGAFFGIVFGAVTVYLALRAGLTVSASIPIAVLAIAILKRMGSTILENNIVQTAGSAGESVAAGVVFTLPALIFLGFGLDIGRIFWIALAGGILGVLFMIPLRRQLIVKEHGNLLYPEGTACADVLIAGEKGGSFAGRVFAGFGVAAVYKILHEGLRLWSGQPTYRPGWYPGGTLAGTTTPEYLGVGYIIGVRVAGIIFAGGVLSWLVLIPMISFFGASIPDAVFPGTIPIAEMTPQQIWAAYIRPIGAGAVTAAGLFTLARTIPTIVGAFKAGFADLRAEKSGVGSRRRTEDDLPMSVVLGGSLLLLVGIWALLSLNLNPGHAIANLVAAVLIVIFGFLFVTVSSRIVGLIGSSANPISGMTIATLMATSLIFLGVGWVGGAWSAVALMVGAVVCIAAANAGATSQDLKTGFLVGATPRLQQLALIIGVLASVAVIGWTLTYLNKAYTSIDRRDIAVAELSAMPEARDIGDVEYANKRYDLVNVIGSRTIPDGRYYYDAAAQKFEWQEAPGIGSADMPAPQAVLMSTVINGILNQSLPWGLVLFGVFIVVMLELAGVRSLAFAVGAYLPIATSAPIFAGGVIRWLIDSRAAKKEGAAAPTAHESEVSSGALFASGLIAGGALAGLLIVAPLEANRSAAVAAAARAGTELGVEPFDMGAQWWPALAQNDLFALVLFIALAGILYWAASRRMET
jgi:putative OPT family oligopeptide transporter